MANDDEISRLAAEVAPVPEWLRRGISATAWNTLGGGLVGLEHPDTGVQEWQAEHPWLNLASELAGFGGLYGAGAKVLKATKYKNVLKAIGSGEKLAEAPFKTRALQEMALMAPIEATRQTAGAVVEGLGDYEGPSLQERAIEGILNTALGGVVAGTLGTIASGGRKIRLPQTLKDLSSDDSWQVNLRKARESLGTIEDPLEHNRVQGLVQDLEGKIRTEWRENFVSALESDPENRLGRLNSLWKGTEKNPSQALVINSETGFKSLKELELVNDDLAQVLPQDWLEYSQFPRVVSPKTAQARAYVDDTLSHTLSPVGNGWYLGREKEGLYVMARKIHDQDGLSRYIFLKTDNPGKFVPEQASLKAITDRMAWRDPASIVKPTGNSDFVLDGGYNFYNLLEKGTRASDAPTSKLWQASTEGVRATAKALGLSKVGSRLADSEFLGNTVSEFKRLFAPTALQFKNSPVARKVYATWQYVLDSAKRRAYETVWGKPIAPEGASLLGTFTKGIGRDGTSFGEQFKKFFGKNPEEFQKFLDVIYSGRTTAEVESGGLLQGEALNFLKWMDRLDNNVHLEGAQTIQGLQLDDSKLWRMLSTHHGMSRFWKGTLRQEVLDENGHLVTIFGGNNKKGLTKSAERLIEEAERNGRKWTLGDYWAKSPEIDGAKLKNLNNDLLGLSEEYMKKLESGDMSSRIPGFTKSRAGIGGFHQASTPQEFLDDLAYSFGMKYDWMGKEIATKLTARDLATLGIDSPEVAAQLEDKLSVLRGEQGVFSTLVNKLADRVLSPVLGANSASRIVDAFNSAHAIFDLGFANLSYTLANILQPITTVLPQLSMLHSCPEALQWAYDGIPLISRSGKGTLANIFSPLKMMKEGMKLLANPESEQGFREFTDWAIREGVISPQFTEAYVGKNSHIGSTLKEAWQKGEFVEFTKELSSYLPRMSEQVSRGYAMAVGYKFFNSIAKSTGLSRDQVYLATKKFVENTMFQYAASDRATVLQGPVGRAWGLFKNWTMHYVGWQMEYLDAAARRGAFAPLLYSNLATSALGGLSASEIGGAIQSFAEWMEDDKMSNLVYDRWGDTATSNFILYGLPGLVRFPGLAGISLKNQVNSPFSDPGEEIQRFMGFVYANRLKAAWNAVGEGIDYWASSGDNPLGSDRVRLQLARAFAPKAFYRSMQMVDDALYSLSGSKVIEGLSPAEQMAYKYFNLPSARISQAMEISSEIWKDKDKRALLTSRYAKVFAEALDAQDGRMMQRIIERALVDGVDVPSMVHNAQTRIKNTMLNPLERNKDYYGIWGPSADVLGL